MALPGIGAIGGAAGLGGIRPTLPGAPSVGGGGQGFGEMLANGLRQVSASEQQVDAVAQDIAAGGASEIHDLMAATAKATVSVDLLVQVRNRAVEAYQEIMRIQV